MRLSLTVAGSAEPLDVLVDVDDDARVADLAVALARSTGSPPDGLVLAGTRLDDDAVLADTDLVDGAVVHLGGGTGGFTPPATGWQLHVVGGPDAGLIVELPVGEHVLGRSSALGFSDRSMSRRHALLRVTGDGAAVADLGSANGTLLEGEPVPDGGGKHLQAGQVVQLGDTLLRINEAQRSDAAIERGAPGSRTFVRAPRLLP